MNIKVTFFLTRSIFLLEISPLRKGSVYYMYRTHKYVLKETAVFMPTK